LRPSRQAIIWFVWNQDEDPYFCWTPPPPHIEKDIIFPSPHVQCCGTENIFSGSGFGSGSGSSMKNTFELQICRSSKHR
jgi:hypothetical protein